MGKNDYINPKLAVCWQPQDIEKIRQIVEFSKKKIKKGNLLKEERQSYFLFIKAGCYLLRYFDGLIPTCRKMPKELHGHADSILESLPI